MNIKEGSNDLSNNPSAVKIVEQEELEVVVSEFVTEFATKSNGIIDIVLSLQYIEEHQENYLRVESAS